MKTMLPFHQDSRVRRLIHICLIITKIKTCTQMPVLIAAFVGMTISAHAGPYEDALQRDAERRERERWEKFVYGDPFARTDTNRGDGQAQGSYCAIAYSESTGETGWGRAPTLERAQQLALEDFKVKDAKIVGWAWNGHYCAIAADPHNVWGFGGGATEASARAAAIKDCKKRTNAECKVITCVSSR